MTTGDDVAEQAETTSIDTPDTAVPVRRRRRQVAGWVLTALACLLVLFALVAPDDLTTVSPWAFVRIPIEALVGLAILLVLPPRPRRIVAIVLGLLLGVLTIFKILDIGFFESLSRPFDPISDWSFLSPAIDFLNGAIGHVGALLAVIGVSLLAGALIVFIALAVWRLTKLVSTRRTGTTRVVAVLAVVWVVLAVVGVQFTPGQPVAARSVATLAYDDVHQVGVDLHDQKIFGQQLASDPVSKTPAGQLLGGLKGKDVILTFVESYGRVAVENPQIGPAIDALLNSGTKQLQAAGYGAETGFLTSSTAGGGSWLAHSTLESGLWINNEQRYNEFTSSSHLTLTKAFHQAGWRTVGDVPENVIDWPQGAVYDFSKLYDSRNVNYQGPSFAYSNMPDQFTMSAFQKLERSNPNHAPVMAEVDLTSSHSPWTHLPRLVNWNSVGSGQIFGPMPSEGKAFNQVWPDPVKIRAAYGQSIQYSLNTLISYIQKYGNKNLVMVFLGDHQPAAPVVNANSGRDVPITIVAKDPNVLKKISGWGWTQGLLPKPNAPVWRMDTFRNKFFTAFGS
jgi:hypothetical protein